MSDQHFVIEYDPHAGITSAQATYFGPRGSITLPVFRSRQMRVYASVDQPIDQGQLQRALARVYEETFGR